MEDKHCPECGHDWTDYGEQSSCPSCGREDDWERGNRWKARAEELEEQVNQLADARDRIAMLVPVEMASGTVEENVAAYIDRLRARVAGPGSRVIELTQECDEASALADTTSNALDKIGAVCGIETWDYAEQPLQAVKAIVKERDDLNSRVAALEAELAEKEARWVELGAWVRDHEFSEAESGDGTRWSRGCAHGFRSVKDHMDRLSTPADVARLPNDGYRSIWWSAGDGLEHEIDIAEGEEIFLVRRKS